MVPKILIVAATPFEISPLLSHFEITADQPTGLFDGTQNVSALITGVGMVNTAYFTARVPNYKFDVVINAGVCGSFKPDLKNGDLVQVSSDTLAELGAEDDTKFLRFEELGLSGTATYFPVNHTNLVIPDTLKTVKAITVNKVHGNDESIKKVVSLYAPDIESMEGAAFFRACEHLDAACIQIRAVSNAVEKRDKSKWNMPLAIKNLNDFLISFINSLPV